LVRLDDVKEILARRAAAVAPSDAKGKADDLAGRIVSVDVSTGDDDYGNRIFAELTGETGSDGTTLLAIETERNFSDAKGKADTANADDEREFVVEDPDLQAFLDAAVGWVKGEPQNMDTGLHMLDLLQRVEARLATSAADAKDAALANRVRDLIADHVADNWPMVRYHLEEVERKLRAINADYLLKLDRAAMAAAPSSAAGKEGGEA
jgi:hypothetical protein